MKLALPLAAALLAAPCAEQQPVRVSPAASKALGEAGDACRTAPAEIPPFPDGGELASSALEAPPPGPTPLRPRPVFEGQPLLPPERPGESASEVHGCLSAERTAAAGARFPAGSAQARDAVRVNPLSSGLIVTHELVHPCCLQVAVSARVEGGAVRVVEALSGAPCACRCASRLRAAIGLAPGQYSVAVVVRGPASEERTAFSGAAAVGGK